MTSSRSSKPAPREPWTERRRRRLRSPLLRKLDRSFRLRLLLALLAAIVALALVNRWEQCRDLKMARGCVWHDAGGVVNVDNLEALSIVTAAILFVLEGGKRRQREHVEAMELVFHCQDHRIRLSHARNAALEQLCEAGIELEGLDLSGADLSEIQLPAARLQGVNLIGANLARADLREADLRNADLREADLSGARLEGARLEGALLEGALLDRALLEGALPDQALADGGDREDDARPGG
jgi:hypothetical protein